MRAVGGGDIAASYRVEAAWGSAPPPIRSTPRRSRSARWPPRARCACRACSRTASPRQPATCCSNGSIWPTTATGPPPAGGWRRCMPACSPTTAGRATTASAPAPSSTRAAPTGRSSIASGDCGRSSRWPAPPAWRNWRRSRSGPAAPPTGCSPPTRRRRACCMATCGAAISPSIAAAGRCSSTRPPTTATPRPTWRWRGCSAASRRAFTRPTTRCGRRCPARPGGFACTSCITSNLFGGGYVAQAVASIDRL